MVTGISEERQEQSIKAGKRVKRQADIIYIYIYI